MLNLIAYIPVLNDRHRKWLESHQDAYLFLITQEMAESLLPRLARNVGALPTVMMAKSIEANNLARVVGFFKPKMVEFERPNSPTFRLRIMPDEDVSYALAEKYLTPAGFEVKFEDIRARYDMTAVKRQSPVMEGIDETSNHDARMELARIRAKHSPDWWRQIGAALFVNGELVAVKCNDHLPTEYVTDIFGDPRINVDAGQPGKYVSVHAEIATILHCANMGISTKGASLWSTVFPCEGCARAIEIAGIDHLFFEEGYSALDAREILEGAGVKIIRSVRPTKDPESA